MTPKILLNETVFHLKNSDMPCLIHGEKHTGTSYFSIALLADYFRQGHKVLFFSAFSRGSDAFISLIPEIKSVGKIQIFEDIVKHKDKQVILVKSGDEELFITALKEFPEGNTRSIFVKNIESFSQKVWSILSDKNNLIVSGNIELCGYKEVLLSKSFKTKILFSNIPSLLVTLPPLEKYEGLLLGQDTGGLVQVK